MLNPDPVGDAIGSYLFQNPIGAAGHLTTLADIQAIWRGIMTIIYDDLKTNAQVNPGTFEANGFPVTGLGGPLV